jgi:hypothetical protein
VAGPVQWGIFYLVKGKTFYWLRTRIGAKAILFYELRNMTAPFHSAFRRRYDDSTDNNQATAR